MLLMKIFRKKNEKIVAICDPELLGKVFSEGELVLNLDKYAGFYSGSKVTANEAAKELKDATSINLVGENAIEVAKNLKLIKDSDIIKIANVPHVQIYKI